MTIKLTWTESKFQPGLHIGQLTAGELGKIAAQIGMLKVNDEGKAFLTRAVNAAAAEERTDTFENDLYSRIEFEKGKR